ncbi:MAG: EAL domain-containing response regulator [Myxococcota bacterium]|nr:EAL domain-containing response regulator [Myxococcota bacterium]
MNHVLVVDDDEFVLRAIQRVLAHRGLQVSVANSGEQAVRMLQGTAFDAALVDYEMPGLDGLKVLSQIREQQPACVRALMTGHHDFPMIVDAVNRGEVLRVISKPFDPRTLVSTLEDAWASVRRMAEVRLAQQRAVEDGERKMLLDCITGGHLRLAIQPIVSAKDTDEVFGFEALLRSTHPVLDGPLSVLRVAERHGMIMRLGEEVNRLAGEILDHLDPTQVLFVNLHPDQLQEPQALMRGLQPLRGREHRCAIEITERSRLQNILGWESTIDAMQKAGFNIAVDDLGSGYNSLSVLADLQPRYIKIDMSIVRGVDTTPRKQRLVELLCKFGEATDALVLGEGVETANEAEALRACGIHLMQGYHFGRPAVFEPEELFRQAG